MYNLDKLFDSLVKVTFSLLTKQSIKTNSALLKAYIRTVQPAILSIDNPRTILVNDIYQQLALLWIAFKKDYDDKKPDVSLKRYMVMRSAWSIRDWLKQELTIPVLQVSEETTKINEDLPITIDAAFLFYGTDKYPFAMLTTYQRYLLFLRFYKDMDYNEIAELSHKTPQTIRTKMNEILNLLRSEYVKQENAN